jgi:hypothetical protein
LLIGDSRPAPPVAMLITPVWRGDCRTEPELARPW